VNLSPALIVLVAAVVLSVGSVQADAFDFVKNGVYGELGGREKPDAVAGEIGLAGYGTENLSFRFGFSFLASENFDDIYTGLTAGARYDLGSRFSPFVGIGIFAGETTEDVPAANDGYDNDDDGFVDEYGEERTRTTGTMLSLYPEVGVHLWVTRATRLTVAGKYHVTTEGRDSDFWLYSFGIAYMF
jgi:opacity protein-like surface antigen